MKMRGPETELRRVKKLERAVFFVNVLLLVSFVFRKQ